MKERRNEMYMILENNMKFIKKRNDWITVVKRARQPPVLHSFWVSLLFHCEQCSLPKHTISTSFILSCVQLLCGCRRAVSCDPNNGNRCPPSPMPCTSSRHVKSVGYCKIRPMSKKLMCYRILSRALGVTFSVIALCSQWLAGELLVARRKKKMF